MNAPIAELTATETQRIEDALHVLLNAATTDLRKQHSSESRAPQSMQALTFALIDRMETWTAAQCAAADLLDYPVGEALRQAVTTLGERLYEIGGLGLMQDTLYAVAERDPANHDRRVGIMDRRWDGIGRTDKLSGWCT